MLLSARRSGDVTAPTRRGNVKGSPSACEIRYLQERRLRTRSCRVQGTDPETSPTARRDSPRSCSWYFRKRLRTGSSQRRSSYGSTSPKVRTESELRYSTSAIRSLGPHRVVAQATYTSWASRFPLAAKAHIPNFRKSSMQFPLTERPEASCRRKATPNSMRFEHLTPYSRSDLSMPLTGANLLPNTTPQDYLASFDSRDVLTRRSARASRWISPVTPC